MLKIATVLLVLFLVPVEAYTDTFSDSDNNFTNNLRLYAHTGFSKPHSPASYIDFWNIGYNLGGGAGYLLFDERFEISIFAGYSNFGYDMKEYRTSMGSSDSDILIEGGNLTATSFSLNVKLLPEKNRRYMVLYITGGLGISVTSLDDVKVTPKSNTDAIKILDTGNILDTGTDPFASAGLGIEIPVKHLQLFCEIQFHMILQDEESLRFFPVKAGVIF